MHRHLPRPDRQPLRIGSALAVIALLLAALPAQQARAISVYELEVLRDGPLHYWTFNEASGNAKSSTNNLAVNELAPSGSATRVSHDAIASGLTLGNAASFNGAAGGRFQASNLDGAVIDFVPTQHWAVEFWVQVQGPNVGSRNDYLMEVSGPGGLNDPGLIYDFNHGGGDTNSLELFKGNRTAAQSPSINDQNWHHVVVAFYGNDAGFGLTGRQEFYLDGTLAATATGTNFSTGFGLVGAAIGNALAGNEAPFEGRIDEVAFYDIGSMVSANPQLAGNRNSPALIAEMQSVVQSIAGHAAAADDGESSKFFVKPVSYSYAGGVQPNPSAGRNDPLLSVLTDGLVARSDAGASLSNDTTVGFNDPAGFNGDNGQPQPQITFNLGAGVLVDEIWIDYLGADGGSGVSAPDSVEILFSEDGINFGGLQTFTGFNDVRVSNLFVSRRLALDIENTFASFVQLRVFSNQEWVFLSEVTFLADTAPVPEPASLALLSLGSLALLRRRRMAA